MSDELKNSSCPVDASSKAGPWGSRPNSARNGDDPVVECLVVLRDHWTLFRYLYQLLSPTTQYISSRDKWMIRVDHDVMLTRYIFLQILSGIIIFVPAILIEISENKLWAE